MLWMVRPQAGWVALAAAVALTMVGIAAIGTAQPYYAPVQMRWLPIALAGAVVCMLPRPRWIGLVSYPLLGVVVVVLFLMLMPFMPAWLVPVRNGARCWINLQYMMFQPSEAAKIVFVLALAWYLRYGDSFRTVLGLLVPLGMAAVPMGLILVEPDLGSAILFIPTLLTMLVAAGARLRHLGSLVGLAVLAVAVNVAMVYVLPDSMQVLKPHQRQRIVALISQIQGDDRYAKDIGYQQDKAMTLVGSGRLVGYGGERSPTIVRFNKLPEDHNDMIFAVIVNRWGLAGGLGTIALYLVFVGSLLIVAARSRDAFSRLATVGFAGCIGSQAGINIAITLGLLPVTGITLPFVSYGGTSLLATFTMVGLVLNFGSRKPTALNWPSFEFNDSRVPA